jgi:Tfp pilus assembly protein PilF
VQDEISREISSRLKLRLAGEEQKRLTRRYTENAEAYKLYLKGSYYWSRPGEVRKSRDYFQQAVDLDPSYALGYVGLAQFYGFMSAQGLMPPKEGWPKSEAAARKALEIDETLAEVHNALAAIRMFYYRDWAGAQREFKRGLELNPNYPEIHNNYSGYLAQMGQLSEAVREGRRALELDPLSPRFSQALARRLYFARQYDQAIEQFGKALELDSNDARAHDWFAHVYEQKGMQKEAIAEWRAAMRVAHDEELANILDRAYSESGFDGAIRAVWQRKLERLQQRAAREYVLPMDFVRAYFRLGQTEQAIMWLERACEEPTVDVLVVKIDPFFDSLHLHPRFGEIVRCLG